jgi:uncharacterized membrane protein (UPF0127 family)
MKLPHMLGNWFRRKSAAADRRMSVLNVTRNTLLASAAQVADRGATRRKGLLGRAELREGEGLWIVPCESVHTIGMQFAIDLVYLDRHKRVKKVRTDVGSWRLSACLMAHSVLELPSGTIVRTETRAGDQLQLSVVTQ